MFVPTLQEMLDGIARGLESEVLISVECKYSKKILIKFINQLKNTDNILKLYSDQASIENSEMRHALREVRNKLSHIHDPHPDLSGLLTGIDTALSQEFPDDQLGRSASSLGKEGNVLSSKMIDIIEFINKNYDSNHLPDRVYKSREELRRIIRAQSDRRDPKISAEETEFRN